MRYVWAKARQESDLRAYRFYVTDSLQAIAHNTTGMVNEGMYMSRRFAEITDRESKQEEDDPRTCAEIVDDMWAVLRGETVG